MDAKARAILALLQSSVMVFMVTLLVTYLNLGFDPDFVRQWVTAYFIAWPIAATTAFLVAAPNYLKGRAMPEQPADLQKHDCIVYHRWGRDDLWWFASPDGAVSVSVRGRFRANNSEAVHRAALNGHGIALLSHLLVADDISAGRLRVLMPAFPPARFPLTVVYPSRRNLPPRVRAVIEFLSEIIQADPAMRDDGDVRAASHTEVYGQD